ncbi:MAG: hypothetical protein RLZZ458_1233 [Planctomycetota bacterium]
MSHFGLSCHRLVFLLFGICLGICCGQQVQAQQADEFEGAVWRFEISRKGESATKLEGLYRISDKVVFQAARESDKEFVRKVGNNYPARKKRVMNTRMEITNFRVAQPNGSKQQTISGSVNLKYQRYGEWTGVFTDRRGEVWEARVTRIRE